MRSYQTLVCVVVLCLLLTGSEAQRDRRKKKCKYDKSQPAVCDYTTKTKTKTYTLIRGDSRDCPQTKVVNKGRCGDCQYDKKSQKWSECVMGFKEKTLTLIEDPNVPNCEPTKTFKKPCKVKPVPGCKYEKPVRGPCLEKNMRLQTKTLKTNNAEGTCPRTLETHVSCNTRSQTDCDYDTPDWGVCAAGQEFIYRTRTLKNKDRPNCDATYIQQKKCSRLSRGKRGGRANAAGCKYQASDWSPCNETSPTATRTMNLEEAKEGHTCEQTLVQTISCERLSQKLAKRERKNARREKKRQRQEKRERKRENKKRKKGKKQACRYSKGDWSECDNTKDTITRTLDLISGPKTCEQTVLLEKKCGKDCKYTPGRWGDCNPSTKIKERIDTLKQEPSKNFCQPTRRVTKKCGKKKRNRTRRGCTYENSDWGECDLSTGQRTKTKKLLSGYPPECEVEKTITKPCVRRNGEARCFFGQWQPWKGCRNGVQTKQRPVLQGGVECQRKGVKTRPCGDISK